MVGRALWGPDVSAMQGKRREGSGAGRSWPEATGH